MFFKSVGIETKVEDKLITITVKDGAGVLCLGAQK